MTSDHLIKVLVGIAIAIIGLGIVKGRRKLAELTIQAQGGLFGDSVPYRVFCTLGFLFVGIGFVISGCITIVMTIRLLYQ